MERNRQLDRTEVGRQMSTRARDALQDKGTEFVGQLFKLAAIQGLEVRGTLNSIKQICRHFSR
jgi:hypothetical protein